MSPAKYRDPRRHADPEAVKKHFQAIEEEPKGILKLRERIDWERFRPLLEEIAGYAQRDWSKGGQPPFDPLLMFKILILQIYHGLSDEATQEQIKVNLRFLCFLGLALGDEVPDAKTIWAFKERIEENGR